MEARWFAHTKAHDILSDMGVAHATLQVEPEDHTSCA